MVEVFNPHDVSVVLVTQPLDRTTSMGWMTLNVLLPFAQFEPELAGERIRDKSAVSNRRRMWTGGIPRERAVQSRIMSSGLIEGRPEHREAFVAQVQREHLCDIGVVFDHHDPSLVLHWLPSLSSIRDAPSGGAHTDPISHGLLLVP